MPPRLDKLYPQETIWAFLSNKLVRHYRLPAGSEFRLKRKGSAQGTRAFMRNDAIIRHAKFEKSAHRLEADLRVKDIVDRIAAMLAPHVSATVLAFGPGREQLHGSTSLETWQVKGPTQQELDDDEIRQDDIKYLQDQAEGLICSMREEIESPEDKVPQAFLKALLEWFDEDEVRAAVAEFELG